MTDEKICPIMSRPGNITLRFYVANEEDQKNAEKILENVSFLYCQKDRCEAWVPERTEFVKGDPQYHGRPDKNLVYPAHCLLISHYETLWPTVHALSGNDEQGNL
jgi:hypothetical protein